MTPKEHTALEEVYADMLSGKIEPENFNMNLVTYHCGTPACLGGHMGQKMGNKNVLDIHAAFKSAVSADNKLNELFDPDISLPLSEIPFAAAVKCLGHFLETGVVDWEGALQ